MPRRKLTLADWWMITGVILILALAATLALTARARAAGGPYGREAALKGAVDWPADTTSRIGITLTELAAAMPPEVEIEGEKPTETAPERPAIQPRGAVQVLREGASPGRVPVLMREQAFQYIRFTRADLTAQRCR
jgi:hypothetical protein